MAKISDAEMRKWIEIGSAGLDAWSGFISEAYNAKLQWPTCEPLYSRIRRSDPEITIVRQLFDALGNGIAIAYEIPEEPTPDDELAVQFGNEALEDIEGGTHRWLDTALSYVPFYGWGWWEVVPGLRREDWTPPDDDDWRSKFDDGLLCVRRLAWRDPSSFDGWEMDEKTGRLHGMWQNDMPHPRLLLPLNRAVHLTFGDNTNPEGLSPLEAVWRLERIMYGLEIVQGMGFEHAAGHLAIETEKEKLSPDDKTHIKRLARAIGTAQEGNYAVYPKGIKGRIEDVTFQAAPALLEAIRHYSVRKLQCYIMSWIALSSTSGTGSYAAKREDVDMFFEYYNAMIEGMVKQLGLQLEPWLFGNSVNRERWPGLTTMPKLKASLAERSVDLSALTTLIRTLMYSGFPIGDDDLLALRRRTGVLPEVLPEEPIERAGISEMPKETEPAPETTTETVESSEEEAEEAELMGYVREVHDDGTVSVVVTPQEVLTAGQRFKAWAKKNAPRVYKLLEKRIK